MHFTKKRGLIALASAVAVALAVAIPTVIASSKAAGPVTTSSPAAGPSPAATTVGACSNSKMSYASDTFAFENTSSTSFVPVTGMSVDFTTTGHCAEITFSNEAAVLTGNLMFVRALVDGTQCLPNPIQWMSDHGNPNYLVATSYTFVCQFGIGDHHGGHNAVIQYSSYTGTPVYSVRPTMVVRYG